MFKQFVIILLVFVLMTFMIMMIILSVILFLIFSCLDLFTIAIQRLFYPKTQKMHLITVVPYGSSFCEASNHASTWKSFHTGHKQERHLPSVWPRCGL